MGVGGGVGVGLMVGVTVGAGPTGLVGVNGEEGDTNCVPVIAGVTVSGRVAVMAGLATAYGGSPVG